MTHEKFHRILDKQNSKHEALAFAMGYINKLIPIMLAAHAIQDSKAEMRGEEMILLVRNDLMIPLRKALCDFDRWKGEE